MDLMSTAQLLGNFGEFVGAIAVVVTLIYLALQIRQNTHQTRLSSIQAINASNDSAFDPIYLAENIEIFKKGQTAPQDLNEHENMVFDMLMMRLFASLDTTTYQFDHGSYDEELYQGALEFFSTFIVSPGGRQWLETRRNSLSSATLERLERTTIETRADA